MHRDHFNDLFWFLAVAEERSFTKAAARLGTSQPTLSRTMTQLEQRLGVRLLSRTTRSVAPTEAGERLLRTLSPRLAEIEGEIESIMALGGRPAGTVRLTLSDHAYATLVWPKLQPVLAAYPQINLEFSIDNGFRDIVEERFDAGVRLGEGLDQDMIAIRIGPDWRMVAVASPSYLEQRERPHVPSDLAHHRCINHRPSRSAGLYAWEFAKDGNEQRIRVSGQLTFNSTLPMVDAAIRGHGIAFVPEDLVGEAITAGRLVQVLDEWCPRFPGYHLYHPSRRQMSPALEVVVQALRVSVQ